MGVGKKFLLVFISVFLILFSISLILGLFVNNFLYPEIYSETLESSGIYKYAEQNVGNLQAGSFLILPEGGVKVSIEGFLSNVLAYIRSDTDTLNLSIRIDKQKLEDFFVSETGKIPICGKNRDPYADKDNPCRPTDMTAKEFTKEYLARNNIFILSGTDVIDLTAVYGLEEGSEGRQQLDSMRSAVHNYKNVLYLLILAVFISIFLIFLLTKSFSNTLRWSGVDFIIAGAILLAGVTLGTNALARLPMQNQQDGVISKILENILPVIVTKVRFLIYIALAIGAALFILSLFFKKDKKGQIKQIQKANKKVRKKK